MEQGGSTASEDGLASRTMNLYSLLFLVFGGRRACVWVCACYLSPSTTSIKRTKRKRKKSEKRRRRLRRIRKEFLFLLSLPCLLS